MSFSCSICSASFRLRRNLLNHERSHNRTISENLHHQPSDRVTEDGNFELYQRRRALSGYLRSFQLQAKTIQIDPAVTLSLSSNLILELVSHTLTEWSGAKAFFSLNVNFHKEPSLSETDNRISVHFNSTQHTFLRHGIAADALKHAASQINLKIDAFLEKGSGWVVNRVGHIDIHLSHYKPLQGSTYAPLPKVVQSKKAIINIKNNDNKCFMWSILAKLHPATRDPQRISHYKKYQRQLIFDNVTFPVSTNDIPKFEALNSLSVNVFGFEDNELIPLFLSQSTASETVDLFLYNGHYSLVRSLDRLLFSQRRKNNKLHVCRRCLIPQYSAPKLQEHYLLCKIVSVSKVKMPTQNVMKFINTKRMQRAPYVIYADFECILRKVDHCKPHSDTSYTIAYQHHEPSGFGLVDIFQCCEDYKTMGHPYIYRGTNSVYFFLQKVITLAKGYQERLQRIEKIHMSCEDWKDFNKATVCYLCKESLASCDRAKDHCHLCGKYRGAAHLKCNIGYQLTRDVTVLFHNLRKYDGVLIMNQIAIICNEQGLTIECLPRALEDYISFAIKMRVAVKRNALGTRKDMSQDESIEIAWRIRFVDSLQFLPASLQSLIDTMKTEGLSKFPILLQHFGPQNIMLLLRKGIYCYDYIDSFSKFEETSLPSRLDFYNQLNDEHITEVDYDHANTVWNQLDLKTLGEYHDLYLCTDVLLLADIFQEFRQFALHYYDLDPVHYFTLPGFSWDACLKFTKVELELLTDVEMYTFLERGIRGGVSMISHRQAAANNKYLSNFNPDRASSFILYLDANNLYGWSLMQKLPINKFRWMSQKEINDVDWTKITCDGPIGWILEVDLEYPHHLHILHNEYPLAPEQLTVTADMLSPFCVSMEEILGRTQTKTTKLIPNLYHKSKYIVHCVNLMQYLRLGMQLTQVHRVIEFSQSDWMSPYINLNTQLRASAKNEFEKNLFKLLNNSTFGKSMENVRDRVDVKLITTQSQFRKLVASDRYKESRVFDNDLVAIMMERASICLNKPIYVGFTVLDLSKSLMYNFHYGYMKEKFGASAMLLFTDTDSLCYWVECDDIYEKMGQNMELFDTSNYSSSHFLYSNHNKKRVGIMKDETSGEPIQEFIGLRSKMYSITHGATETRRAKGVKKAVTKNELRHAMYKQCLQSASMFRHEMKMIRCNNHHIFSVLQNKISLSPYDDKRYLMNDGISSLAYGHFAITETIPNNIV